MEAVVEKLFWEITILKNSKTINYYLYNYLTIIHHLTKKFCHRSCALVKSSCFVIHMWLVASDTDSLEISGLKSHHFKKLLRYALLNSSLREKCPYSEFFELLAFGLNTNIYSVSLRVQESFKYGHFLPNGSFKKTWKALWKTPLKLLFLSKVADRYARQMNATTDEFLVNV